MLWNPEDWDAVLARTEKLRSHGPAPLTALHEALEKVPDAERKTVADLGCGSGALLPLLADRFGHCVAIDYAPQTLARARKSCSGGAVRFRRRDLRDLTPFRNSFHVAVAVESIVGPRLEDIDRMLEQVRRSLVEGGRFFAVFPAMQRQDPPRPMRLAGHDHRVEVLCFHEVELQYRLTRHGFQGIRLRRVRDEDAGLDKLLATSTARANN